MTKMVLGSVCGLIYGSAAAAAMLPMEFPDKRAALAGAFLNRFAIGFVIGIARTTWPGWVSGLALGLLLSLPDAIITKAWAPILIFGAIGGAIIGWVVGRWGQ